MIERIFQMEGEESALAFIRAPDSKSRSTALHSAAEAGDAGLCARLIELGADVHATDLARHTALHKAAQVTLRCALCQYQQRPRPVAPHAGLSERSCQDDRKIE